MIVCAQLASSSPPESRIPLPGEGCCPQWTSVPTSVNTVKMIPHMHAQWPIFQGILDSVKLTINSNHPLT